MQEYNDNFIEYDHEKPADVFSSDEVDFMERIYRKLSSDEVKKLRAVEGGAFNKTTKRSSFSTLLGLRKNPGQGCVYFSKFSKNAYSSLLKMFLSRLVGFYSHEAWKIITSL